MRCGGIVDGRWEGDVVIGCGKFGMEVPGPILMGRPMGPTTIPLGPPSTTSPPTRVSLSFFLSFTSFTVTARACPAPVKCKSNIYFRNYQIVNNNEGRSILKSNWWCAFMVECQMIHVVTLPIKRTFNTTKPNIYKRTQIINTTYLCFISHLPFYAPMRSIKYKIHNSSKPPNGAFLCFLRDGDEPDDDHY